MPKQSQVKRGRKKKVAKGKKRIPEERKLKSINEMKRCFEHGLKPDFNWLDGNVLHVDYRIMGTKAPAAGKIPVKSYYAILLGNGMVKCVGLVKDSRKSKTHTDHKLLDFFAQSNQQQTFGAVSGFTKFVAEYHFKKPRNQGGWDRVQYKDDKHTINHYREFANAKAKGKAKVPTKVVKNKTSKKVITKTSKKAKTKTAQKAKAKAGKKVETKTGKKGKGKTVKKEKVVAALPEKEVDEETDDETDDEKDVYFQTGDVKMREDDTDDVPAGTNLVAKTISSSAAEGHSECTPSKSVDKLNKGEVRRVTVKFEPVGDGVLGDEFNIGDKVQKDVFDSDSQSKEYWDLNKYFPPLVTGSLAPNIQDAPKEPDFVFSQESDILPVGGPLMPNFRDRLDPNMDMTDIMECYRQDID